MKKLALFLFCFSSTGSVNSFANALIMVSLEQLKSATIPQATFENFLKNHNFINDELQKAVDAWGEKPSESAEIWFPICMGYENQIAILENNTQYKKQFNAQLEDGMMAFDDALKGVKDELSFASKLCQKAKTSRPKLGLFDDSTQIQSRLK